MVPIRVNDPDIDFDKYETSHNTDEIVYFLKRESISIKEIKKILNKCKNNEDFNNNLKLLVNLTHNIRKEKLKDLEENLNFFDRNKKEWVKKLRLYINK